MDRNPLRLIVLALVTAVAGLACSAGDPPPCQIDCQSAVTGFVKRSGFDICGCEACRNKALSLGTGSRVCNVAVCTDDPNCN